ncbi:hypothetical protein D3C72_2458240 [compost metagenome]
MGGPDGGETESQGTGGETQQSQQGGPDIGMRQVIGQRSHGSGAHIAQHGEVGRQKQDAECQP